MKLQIPADNLKHQYYFSGYKCKEQPGLELSLLTSAAACGVTSQEGVLRALGCHKYGGSVGQSTSVCTNLKSQI